MRNSFLAGSLTALFLLSSTTLAEVKVLDGVVQPFSIVFDEAGDYYGVEYADGNRVFQVKDGELKFISGYSGGAGSKVGDIAEGDGGQAKDGRYNGMHDLVLTSTGMIYIADTFNHRVRSIDLETMQLETLVGNGEPKFKDGKLDSALLNGPFTIALSPDEKKLLVADLSNRRVREIDLEAGTIRTVAGNGKRGKPEDGGLAVEQPLVSPRAAIYGAEGTIYIASREGHALRHVDAEGRIHTLVNKAGTKGYSGDDGPGAEAQLNGPKHLCLDPNGDIVIADDQNQCIRLYKVKEGTIHLLAGMPGEKGDKVGEGKLDTKLNRPHGARYDAEGRLWVCDSWNNRILCFE